MRIRVAQDKTELVQNLLCTIDNPQGVFTTYADIMVFAASLGKKYQYRIPLEIIAKEPNPISIEVFNSRGYEPFLKLLALLETNNPETISADNVNSEAEIITIFEEYANGGLTKLQENTEFDLSRFLP